MEQTHGRQTRKCPFQEGRNSKRGSYQSYNKSQLVGKTSTGKAQKLGVLKSCLNSDKKIENA